MVTGKELQNMWLISLTDGKKVGEIKDLYLDSYATRVAAVFLGKEGMFSRKSLVIDRAFVQICGIDVWLLSEAARITSLDDLAGSEAFIFMNDLRGREVHTRGGSRIGTIGDVLLDREARVQGFTLGKNFMQGGALAEKKGIVRAAFVDLGSKDHPAILDLPKAESLNLPE